MRITECPVSTLHDEKSLISISTPRGRDHDRQHNRPNRSAWPPLRDHETPRNVRPLTQDSISKKQPGLPDTRPTGAQCPRTDFFELSPMNRSLFLLFLLLLPPVRIGAQMLFSENMTMSIDSAKTLQGTITPSLNFQTEKENALTFKNSANINLLIHRDRVVNLLNKFEFSSYGKEVTLSGGYIHGEYRYLLDRAFEVYPYAESQWAGSRGMAFKFSSGLQSRYRLVHSPSTLVFAAAGLFYEYEEWERATPTPHGVKKAYSHRIKSHLSVSVNSKLGQNWELTATAIHQATPDAYFSKARFGAAVDLKYRITSAIGLRGTYRLIYDTAPIVEVRKNYTLVDAGLDITF